MRFRSLPPIVFPPVVIPIVLLLFASLAFANPPVPWNSYVAPCLVACPAGDSTFVIITRTAPGIPWSSGNVVVEFCGCDAFRLASSQDRPYLVDANGCAILRQPDGLGVSLFPIAGGGRCGLGQVRIFAGGVPFGSRAIVTPDQDGDWIVTEDDVAALALKVGTNDPSGDFNCDGIVSAVDLAIAWAHLGHRGDLITDVTGASWGRLKMVYR